LDGEAPAPEQRILLEDRTRMLGRVDVAREVIQDTYERIQGHRRAAGDPRAML
jgi:hypothetical protein